MTKTEKLAEQIREAVGIWSMSKTLATAKILAICKEAGVAFVGKDAKLPLPLMDIHLWRDYSPDMAYEKAQNDMLKAGFRKIEPIEVIEVEVKDV